MKEGEKLRWDNPAPKSLTSKNYICGYCGEPIASEKGFPSVTIGDVYGGGKHGESWIYICHFCTRPTFFDFYGKQTPGIAFGGDVKNIEDENVQKLYQEARRATSANCHTAAILCCRKLLMHIAVSKGTKAGENFVSYVKYLSDNNYVPPDAKDWVDHIRNKGNEANHEITIMEEDESKELIEFSEMLLKIIFEFPAKVKNKYGTKVKKQTTATKAK
jgi:hypothetical protein